MIAKCQYCGKPYTKKHGNQKYCSPQCAENRKLEQTAESRMKNYYKRKKLGGDKIYGLGSGGLGAHRYEDEKIEKEKIDKEFKRLGLRSRHVSSERSPN